MIVNKGTFGSAELADMLYFETIGQDEVEIELIGLCTDICVVSNAILIKTKLPEAKVTVDQGLHQKAITQLCRP